MALNPPPPIRQPVIEGNVFSRGWSGWFRNLHNQLNAGVTGTIPIPALTGGGNVGSITFVNGIITGFEPPT